MRSSNSRKNQPLRTSVARSASRGSIVGAVIASMANMLGAAPPDASTHEHSHALRDVVVFVPDSPRVSTLHASGQRVVVPIEHLWRPMCSSHPSVLTKADLLGIAADSIRRQASKRDGEARLARSAPPDGGGDGGDGEGGGDPAEGGFDLEFDSDASVPSDALDALDRIEEYFESRFSDDVIVTVNVEFDDTLPGGVLGATSTSFARISWNASRNGLRNDMDADDVIQDYLPPGSTIPVRYNGNSAFITNENRVYWTVANYNAAVGFVSGDAGTLRFNEDINWDYDPDDGVAGYSFIDVVIHEVGHALGFASGVDFRDHDIEALDIFRFQRTDGAFDYNPDAFADWQTTPRLASYNLPNNDVVSDIRNGQFKMEDGFPYQASHLYDKSPPIGIMDPVLGQGQTFAPNFMRTADLRLFDAIGWDR